MTSTDIQKALRSITPVPLYRFDNGYIFPWESDHFVQTPSFYTYEYEIKISRSDFFADFKKVYKHKIIKNGYEQIYSHNKLQNKRNHGYGMQKEIKLRPNYFFYAVPEGLVKADEIPSYAGLIYVKDGRCTIIKNAPKLHKHKVRIERKIAQRLYYKTIELRNEIAELKKKLSV
jgi:hypothetical protein